jgi:hypothetical protein
VQVTVPSATAVGSHRDRLQEYVQKLRLLVTRLRECPLRKKWKWLIGINHRGRVRSPDTRNIHQIFLMNGTQRKQASQNRMMTSTMILGQSIEST